MANKLKQQRNRLSPAGRAACAAAGRRNAVAWNDRRAAVRAQLAALTQETRNGLLAELGATPTHAQRILVESATVSCLALRIVSTRLAQARTTPTLLNDMIRLQSETRRALRALGFDLHDAGDGEPSDEDALESLLARYGGRMEASDGANESGGNASSAERSGAGGPS